MSGNYAQLETASVAYNTAVKFLYDKNVEKDNASRELLQSTNNLNASMTEADARTSQATSIDTDLAKATSDETALTAQRTTLLADKAAAVAARIAISNKSVPGQTPVVAESAGTLFVARGAVTTKNGLVTTKIGERNVAFTAMDAKRVVIYDLNSELETLLAALKTAEAQLAQNPTYQPYIDNVADANTDITNKRAAIDAEKLLLGPLETTYDTKVTELGVLVTDLRTLEGTVVTLEADYNRAYLSALDLTNRLQDIEGSNTTNPDASPVGAPLATSRLGLASSNKVSLDAIKIETDLMKASAVAAKSAIKTIYDSDLAKDAAAKSAATSAESDLNNKKNSLEEKIKIQKRLEIDAATKLLEDFLQKYDDVRVSSAPGVSTAVRDAVALTCPGSNARNLLSRIQLSYSDEASYISLYTLLTTSTVDVFFDSIMDECFKTISKEYAESIMNEIKAEFAEKAAVLLAKYRGIISGSDSKVSAWVVVVIALVVAALLFFLLGGSALVF